MLEEMHLIRKEICLDYCLKTDQLILIRRDSGEDDLRKNKRLMLFVLEIGDFPIATVGVSTKNQVYPRLIPMHRVEHNLQHKQANDHRRKIIVLSRWD